MHPHERVRTLVKRIQLSRKELTEIVELLDMGYNISEVGAHLNTTVLADRPRYVGTVRQRSLTSLLSGQVRRGNLPSDQIRESLADCLFSPAYLDVEDP